MTDQFEAGMPSTNDGQEKGVASEGVIAYRVQTRNPTVQVREGNKKPLYLMTLKALQPGQSAVLDDGVTLTVTAARPDGFAIRIGPGASPWTSVSEGRQHPRRAGHRGHPPARAASPCFWPIPTAGSTPPRATPRRVGGPWTSVSEGASIPGAPGHRGHHRPEPHRPVRDRSQRRDLHKHKIPISLKQAAGLDASSMAFRDVREHKQ